MSVSLIDGHIDNDVQEMTFEEVKRIRENPTERCDIKELQSMISTAIEKQIPKKPVRKQFGKYCCSVCGNSLLLSSTKFCSECGQAADWNVVLMTKEECKELVLREFPDYSISRIEEDENYYEVCVSKIDGWTTRVLLVKKISGFIREIGV